MREIQGMFKLTLIHFYLLFLGGVLVLFKQYEQGIYLNTVIIASRLMAISDRKDN